MKYLIKVASKNWILIKFLHMVRLWEGEYKTGTVYILYSNVVYV